MLQTFDVPLINPNKSATKAAYVYKHTSPSGKYYIGQTTDLDERWAQHVRNANNHQDDCRVFEAAIRKYGANNIAHETLIKCNENMVDYYEILFIKVYQSTNPEFGYNLREGGNGACTPEMRAQMVIGNNKKIEKKAWRDDQLHNEKLKYVYWYHEIIKSGKLLEGYRVTDHPNGVNKTFSLSSLTMDQKYAAAREYKLFLDSYVGYFDPQIKTPKGISKYRSTGFRVRCGVAKERYFYTGNSEVDRIDAIKHLRSICPDDQLEYVFKGFDIPDL